MKRSWLAVSVLAVGFAAILLIWFGFGGDRVGHSHGNDASAVLVGDGAESAEPAASSSSDGSADPAGTGGSTNPGPSMAGSDEHAAHGAVAGSATSSPVGPAASAGDPSASPADPAGSSAAAQAEPVDPDAPAPDRRQVSLAEAAGGASAPTTAAPMVDRWLDADAAGVNEGTKQQAAEVALQAAPKVDPTELLPAHGLANGCVAGYGRGTVCLPQTPPSHAGHGGSQDMSGYWTCAESRTLLPDGIVVDRPGTDPLGLDSNGDGTACGAGDR